MSQTALMSVAIVNYNRREDLRAAIASVKAQDYPDVEIIVVDNASTDGSVEMLQAEFPELKSIVLTRNIGMDGYSVACRAAKGEVIFQMDNDSLMPDNTILSRIAAGFARAPDDVAILATRVEEFRAGSDDIEKLRERDLRQGPMRTLGYHSGGVAFRHSLMDKVGFYNEDVFLYGAELFLQTKALAAGFKILLYPDILMLHKSSRTARSAMAVYFETRNRYWFLRYFGTRWQQIKYLPWMVVHDFIYSFHRRGTRLWTKAVFDGFGTMPASLKPRLCPDHPEFRESVAIIARSFLPINILRRVVLRLEGKRVPYYEEEARRAQVE